jgi:uncharacterized repeat protein (TIGR03803 family)
MKRHSRILGAFLSAVLLAACGGNTDPSSSTPLSVAPLLPSQPALGRYQRALPLSTLTVLYSFAGPPKDGAEPYFESLIDVGGALYGTTLDGGDANVGTVFKITTSGKETVLHNFGKGSDGADPWAGLTDVKGKLYGTTALGGTSNYGTVFSITPSGKETVLYRFKGGTDGYGPFAGLMNVNGTLYGATWAGGGTHCFSGEGCGTVYAVTTSGKETVLHRFAGGKEGYAPETGLTKVGGALYGTTEYGGRSGCTQGCGTVFKITTSGAFSQVYSFGASSGDGEYPQAALLDVSGTLYGTTVYGGSSDSGHCGTNGCGIVFAVTTSGAETVIHRFAGYPKDGSGPDGALIRVGKTLYGTTVQGGANGYGTVFDIAKSGAETVLQSFGGPTGAPSGPYAGLTNVSGMLYGMTAGGGAQGDGTVFSISP